LTKFNYLKGLSLEEADRIWRRQVARRCGGVKFDAPGTGYGFTQVLTEEARLAEQNVLGLSGKVLIRMSVADPTWKMWLEAMERAMEYFMKCPDATRYTDLRGILAGNGTELGDTHLELMEYLISQYPELSKIEGFGPDWIQYSPGSIKSALANYVSSTFFEDDKVLIFPIPGYPVIKEPENCYDINVINVPMVKTKDGWKFPLPIKDEKINKSLSSYKGRFVYINNPHNPTGTALTKEEWYEILEWADEMDVLIIVDEAYDLIKYGDSPSILDIPGWWKRCSVFQSVSKGYNATGMRFGWIVGNPTTVKAMRRPMDKKDSGLPGPIIAAALECLRHPEWAEETRERYRRLHEILAKGLKEAGFDDAEVPAAALCQFTKVPHTVNGRKFNSLVECVQWFREKLRISLMHFELNGEGYLRWAITIRPLPEYGLPTEESVIEEAVRRLKEQSFFF
jgi:aspartate/methionine/tyrosine aminotransferase